MAVDPDTAPDHEMIMEVAKIYEKAMNAGKYQDGMLVIDKDELPPRIVFRTLVFAYNEIERLKT
jgi:hypothetical protein